MSMIVHPDHHRQGYGKLLVNAYLKRAGQEEHKIMYSNVDVKNEGAEALCRQCGFQDAGDSVSSEVGCCELPH